MTYEQNVKAILESNFAGFKEEIIDIACKRICMLEDNTERVYRVHWKPDKVFKTQAERDAYIYGYGDGHEDGCSDGRAQALEIIDGCAEETVKKVEEHKMLHMTLLAQQYDTELIGILRARHAVAALKGVEHG